MIPEPENEAGEKPRKGCFRRLAAGCLILVVVILLIAVFGGYYYTGTENFAEFVRMRVERNLESHFQRDVTIGRVRLIRSYPARIFIEDLRIANAPNGVAPFFARVHELEIVGGVQSFATRTLDLGKIYIRGAEIHFEVYPEEHALEHNWPTWIRSRPRKYEITRMELDKLYISGVQFFYNDIRREMRGQVRDVSSVVSAQFRKGIYQGTGASDNLVFQIQDYKPIAARMRASFYYKPGSLDLRSVALNGQGLEAYLSGKIEPLTGTEYDFKLTSKIELERIQEIFRVEQPLRGTLALDSRLKGKQGNFNLTGSYRVPRLKADVYDLADLRGKLDVTDRQMKVHVASADYGGGSISADYLLSKYAEPYPMSVDLRYDKVSLEKLFEDWGVKNLGLRGAATGALEYEWNKEDILQGHGEGRATLQPGAVAFGKARYPLGISGNSRFALNRGVITFANNSRISTKLSDVGFAGTLAIETLAADMKLNIRSSDFSELDRIGYNIALSADKTDYELLGLGGSGTITGTLRGRLDQPEVVASIVASRGKYNDQLLGDGEIDLRYAGSRSVLTFDRAQFRDGDAAIGMSGTISFPDRGPAPIFDLRVNAERWPVQRAVDLVELKIAGVGGLATGSMLVKGSPDDGIATFQNLQISQNEAELRLNGDVDWAPGEGNVRFNLDIGAESFPVADIAAFLELGEIPVTGEVTGTLHLEGHKTDLQGAGSVIVRNGNIFGEPIEIAMADLLFTEGVMRVTHLELRAPAGTLSGEAEVNLATETFSYVIRTAEIDPTKLNMGAGLKGIFTGNVRFSSSGAGTFTQPELVLEAFVPEGTFLGRPFPEGTAPQIYLSIRNGEIAVRGGAFDLFSIDGSGVIAQNGDLSGNVTLAVTDIARFMATFAPAAQIPAEGNIVANLQLGGNTSSLETIVVTGTIPVFNLTVAGQTFTIDPPALIALRNGRLEVQSFTIARGDATFSVQGAIALAGNQEADLRVNGTIDAALFELFSPGARAKGKVNLTMGVSGSLKEPRIVGRADLQGLQLKVPGFPQLLDNINGQVIFSGDRIELEAIRAELGGGTLLAGGTILVDGMQVRRIGLRMQGTDVAVRYFEGVALEGDFNMAISGTLEQMLLSGAVTVDRAVYSRDFAVTGAVLDLLLERRGLVPQTPAAWQQNVALRVDVSAPGTLAVDNNIAEITGSAELRVSGTLASPILLGDIDINEGGRVRFQDVDYRVTRGTVTFQNPFRIDPYFDITAEGRVQEYDLTVNLNGTMERIQTSVTSDPPVSDLTLLSLLGPSNIGQDDRTSALAGQGSLEAAGTSLLYSSLGGLIGSRVLPFADSFRLDAGTLEGTSNPEPTVTFEERISNDLRVIIVYNTVDHTEDQQIIEWQVTPRWLLQFTRTGEEEYRGEARFRRRYNGYWASVIDREETALKTDASVPFTPPPPPPTTPRQEATQQRLGMYGLPITSIEMRPDAPADTTHLLEDIPVKVGEPLSIRKVQDSISRIYATGDYRDIRIDAAQSPSGVALTIVLSLNYRITTIEINGAGRNKAGLQRELDIRVGDVLSLSGIDENAESIREELGNLGYLEATVDPETRFFRETNRAEVIFHIERGPQAKIASIDLEGDPSPFSESALIKRMRQKVGGTYLRTRQKREADRVEGYLAEQDRRRAKVEFLRDEYDPQTDRVRLAFSVEVGPVVEVRVEGVERSAVRKWLPFRRDSERYSLDVVDGAADRIITEYQRRGFYHAAVDMNEESVDGRWVIIYKVSPGQKYELDQVAFDGNEKLEEGELAEAIETSRPGALRRFLSSIIRRPTGVTGEQLSDDRDVLEAYYRLNGFPDVEVGAPVVQTSPDGKMDVVFNITEGPQTIVTEVTIEGNEVFRRSALPDLQTEVGKPYNLQIVEGDRVSLQAFYADQGHVEMQVKPLVETSEDKTSATVTFRVAEGPKITVDEVSARGNTFTSPGVIFRSAGLRVGEPFTYRNIYEAQRNLYRLGIFRRVDLFPEEAGTDVNERDIAIEVEEGQNLSTAGSFGYSTEEGVSISGSVAHRNLFGTARYLGLEGRIAQETDRLFLTYREPFTFGTDIPTQVTFFRTDEEDRPGARIQSIGTFVEASKIIGTNTRVALRYEYEISDCASGDLCDAATGDIPIEGLPLEDQEVQISSFTPSIFWDRRDDPFSPHRGMFASASLEYAFPFRQATAEFLKGAAQGAWYLPTGPRSEFVLSARIGLIDPTGGTEAEESFVPYPERFVAGGISSHRAFDLDELGIEGETLFCFDDRLDPETGEMVRTVVPCAEGGELVPFGGNALVLINAEYRFPIFGELRGALFVDAGNIWAEIGDIDYNEFRYGVGIGARYVTPVGPLRVDWGYKIDREEWEDAWAIAITLGYPF